MRLQRHTLFFILLLISNLIIAQNIAINTTGTVADASAMLDVTSTTNGILIPRMTSAQRNAIVSPAESLLVYDSDENLFYYFTGGNWVPLLNNINGWTTLGNAGTNVSNNFLGTTDDNALAFRVNNVHAGLITNDKVVFIGYNAGVVNTDTVNVGIGSEALLNNVDGTNNTAIGFHSLLNNVYGSENTAVGSFALLNSNNHSNTAIGALALTNSTANGNTAVGAGAMWQNLTGESNCAFGVSSLTLNTIGYYNSGFGYSALFSNTTGTFNTALGYRALYYNTTGDNNIAIGYNAGDAITTGYGNVAVGNNALGAITTGYSNVAIGNTAGSISNGFTSCTIVGYGAGLAGLSYNNTSAFGSGTVISASNQVRIGNTFVTSIGGYANWTNISDGRFKINVQENVPGLDFIMALRPVTYNLDVAAINNFHHVADSLIDNNSVVQKTAQVQTGFIAQEVENAAQQLNYDFSGVDAPQNEESTYGLRYAEFVVPLVKAVQEQQSQIETLQKLVAEQNEMIKQLMQEK